MALGGGLGNVLVSEEVAIGEVREAAVGDGDTDAVRTDLLKRVGDAGSGGGVPSSKSQRKVSG